MGWEGLRKGFGTGTYINTLRINSNPIRIHTRSGKPRQALLVGGCATGAVEGEDKRCLRGVGVCGGDVDEVGSECTVALGEADGLGGAAGGLAAGKWEVAAGC